MATLRAQGLSYHRLADTLNADRVPTKQVGAWHAQTVKNILEAAAKESTLRCRSTTGDSGEAER